MDYYFTMQGFLSQLPTYNLSAVAAAKILISTMNFQELKEIHEDCHLLMMRERIQTEVKIDLREQPPRIRNRRIRTNSNIIKKNNEEPLNNPIETSRTEDLFRSRNRTQSYQTQRRRVISPPPTKGITQNKISSYDIRNDNRRKKREERFGTHNYQQPTEYNYLDIALPNNLHCRRTKLSSEEKERLDRELDEYMSRDIKYSQGDY